MANAGAALSIPSRMFKITIINSIELNKVKATKYTIFRRIFFRPQIGCSPSSFSNNLYFSRMIISTVLMLIKKTMSFDSKHWTGWAWSTIGMIQFQMRETICSKHKQKIYISIWWFQIFYLTKWNYKHSNSSMRNINIKCLADWIRIRRIFSKLPPTSSRKKLKTYEF